MAIKTSNVLWNVSIMHLIIIKNEFEAKNLFKYFIRQLIVVVVRNHNNELFVKIQRTTLLIINHAFKPFLSQFDSINKY